MQSRGCPLQGFINNPRALPLPQPVVSLLTSHSAPRVHLCPHPLAVPHLLTVRNTSSLCSLIKLGPQLGTPTLAPHLMVPTCIPLPHLATGSSLFLGVIPPLELWVWSTPGWSSGQVSLLRYPVKLLLISPVTPQPTSVPTPLTRLQTLPSTTHLLAFSFKMPCTRKLWKDLRSLQTACPWLLSTPPMQLASLTPPEGRFPLCSTSTIIPFPFPHRRDAYLFQLHHGGPHGATPSLPAPRPILLRKQW